MRRDKLLLHIKWFILALLTGGLFWIGWVPRPIWPALLIAMIPVLWIEDEISRSGSVKTRGKVFLYSYLAFLFWNLFTTWWVSYTTAPIAGYLAFILNALLMCLPFLLFHITKKRLGETLGYISLPAYWLTFEFIHLRWDLSWPWLTLGNGLSMYPKILQWYEYTGVPGGSLWILACNILLFLIIKRLVHRQPGEAGSVLNIIKTNYEIIGGYLLILVAPVIISLYIYKNVSANDYGFVCKKNFVVVQPNIDPYGTKFDPSSFNAQLENLLTLTKQKITDETDYVVWPETALPESIQEDQFETNQTLLRIRQFLRDYPRVYIVAGIDGFIEYKNDATATARKLEDGSGWYDEFNSGIQFNLKGNFQVYHKSRLVPAVEQMPYPAFFKFLEPLAINMGGTTGSLGKQDHPGVFFSSDRTGIAPIICYESIYGEYCSEYVDRGAHIFCIMTNDGWWGNSDGHIQHLYYGALRAIENRKPIARSANTGTSCFVDIKGNIEQATEYWKPAVITASLPKNTEPTFYTLYGDYISRIMIGVSLWLILYSLIKRKLDGPAKII